MLRYLIEKEFKQIRRNSFVPKIIFGMPIMVMLVLPWAANQSIKNVNISVVDNDHSVLSERLVQKITASDYFNLTDVSATYEGAMQSIESGMADIIFEIENDFEKKLINEHTAHVMISANSVNGIKGGLGSSYLASILSEFARQLTIDNGQWTMDNGQWTMDNGQPRMWKNYQLSIINCQLNKFNPHLDYKVFMIPALMVMLLTAMTGILPALNIVGEKEAGTIEQINVTPVKRIVFIIAKLLTYWIIGLVVLSICMGVAALIYGLYPAGSLLTIYFFAALFLLVISGFGLVISNYSNTLQQAMFVVFFFIMIFVLMSGLFTPVASMPDWAQKITIFNPLKYLMQVMRMVYLKGSDITNLFPQLIALSAFAIFFNGWAVLSYKKSV